jgi:hypothetical protein
MTNQKTIAEIQNLPVLELQEELSGLTHAQLAELRELEAKESKRVTALSAIDAAIAAASPANPTSTDADLPVTTTPLADPKAEAPATEAWQQPDYAGPLDIEQMDWRRRNIKPVQRVRTK